MNRFLILAVASIIACAGAFAQVSMVLPVNNDGSSKTPQHQQWYEDYAADSVLDGQSVSTSAITTVTSFDQSTFNMPVKLSVICKTTTTAVPAGDVTIIGTNQAGTTITDALTFTENQATAVESALYFSTVTSIAWPDQDDSTAPTYDVGIVPQVNLELDISAIGTNGSSSNDYAYVIDRIDVHLSAAGGTSENLVVTIDSGTDANLDVVVLTQDMELVQNLVYIPDRPLVIDATDVLDITYANTNNKDVGVDVIYHKIDKD